MQITEKSCTEFIGVLASSAPVPGGGGASALVGAIGAALGNMVGSLTVGKKKYASVQPELSRLMEQMTVVQSTLLSLVERDAAAFLPLAAAYALPTDTDAARLHKEAVMELALSEAAEPPMEMLRACTEALLLLDRFASLGSPLALSDAAVGAALCRAAAEGAHINVLVNTRLMKNRLAADTLNQEADTLLTAAEGDAKIVCAKVAEALR